MNFFKVKTFIFAILFLMSFNIAIASVNPNSQLVNLNLQIKSKNKITSSDLMMPFYQSAELEKMIGNRNVFIELNPKRGKLLDEISLEVKFSNASGAKAFFKKEIVAKVNQLSKISYKGITLQVKPAFN